MYSLISYTWFTYIRQLNVFCPLFVIALSLVWQAKRIQKAELEPDKLEITVIETRVHEQQVRSRQNKLEEELLEKYCAWLWLLIELFPAQC